MGIIFDQSRGIYVARELLTKNPRVIRAANKVLLSVDYDEKDIEKLFAEWIVSDSLRDNRAIDVVSSKGLNALLKELELPKNFPRLHEKLRSRILTTEEYQRFSKWAGKNDSIMYETMDKPFGAEIVYNCKKCSYQIARTDEGKLQFDDITEANMNSPSPPRFELHAREVISKSV